MRFLLFTFCLHFLLGRHVYFFSDLVPWLSFLRFLSSPAPPFSSTSTRFFLVCSRTLVMSFFLRYTSSDSLFSNFSPSNFFRKKFACWRRDGSKVIFQIFHKWVLRAISIFKFKICQNGSPRGPFQGSPRNIHVLMGESMSGREMWDS